MSATPSPAFASTHFLVRIGGNQTPVGEVSGIEVTVGVLDVQEGSDLATGLRQPGQTSYSNLVLKRPLTKDATLWQWMQTTSQGVSNPVDLMVVMLDTRENPVIEWLFRNAFPVRWTGPSFNARTNDLAVETLEIAHSGFTMSLSV
jgi:phage tail-like protein